MLIKRRDFLKAGSLATASLFVPQFLKAVEGKNTLASNGKVLVVLQMSGGNDGLNTVIPTFAPEYYKLRSGIAIPEKEALKLAKTDGLGLHPAMTGLRDMYDAGMLSIVQGVGYPNPNRSHFKSMDIWHTADTTATSTCAS